MNLTVVGCAGSFPGPDSAASCYLIEHDGTRILFDMGNGSLGQLFRYTDVYGIDAVFISHLHIDHCVDLCSYYVARKYRPDGAPARIPVYGPPGIADRMARVYDLESTPGMNGEFEFREFDGSAVEVGPISVTASLVEHIVPCYGLRAEAGGRSVVYSGDTGPCDALRQLADGADLALFEASLLDSPSNPCGLHLSGRDAAVCADQAGIDRLVLTHLVVWNDPRQVLAEAKAAFSGEVSLARPGLVLEV